MMVAVFGVVTQAWTVFDLERPGTRPAGLGGAFCAVADDADTMIYNPAGLGQVYTSVVAFNYVSLLSGLDDGSLTDNRIAYLQPLSEAGTLGVLWYQRRLAGLYQENIVSLGYGLPLGDESNYLIGGALKLFFQDFLDSDAVTGNPLFDNGSSSQGVGIDLGGLVYLSDDFNLGFSIANLNQPNMALGDTDVIVPVTLRFGGAYQYEQYLGTLECMLKESHYRISGGGEAWWFDGLLGTRAGIGIGDQDMSELSAGLSFRFEQIVWTGQLDYAFVVPIGSLAGGATHQFNISVLFGSGFEDGTERRAEELIRKGKKAQEEGEREKALVFWEEAAEIFSEDEELAADIQGLREDMKRDSESRYYIERGLAFEANESYLNAAVAYRKAMKLSPEKDQVPALLENVENKIRQMSKRQQQLQKKKEKQAKLEAQALTREKAVRVFRAASNDLTAAKKNTKIMKNFSEVIARLTKQLTEAGRKLKRKRNEKTIILAQAISKELGGLALRATRLERAKARKKKIARKSLAKAPVSSGKKQTAKIPVKAGKKAVSPKTTADSEQIRKMKKRARGAYGRVVKLMLDIDKLNGEKYFPGNMRKHKQELSRIKSLMKQKKYRAAIKAAEKVYPPLTQLKNRCEKKEKARKAMPTNW